MWKAITKSYIDARDSLTPVSIVSTFHQNGRLTPTEFLKAGDHLVQKCPFWQWHGGEQTSPYLPLDRQYLFTSGIVSECRYTDKSNPTVTSLSPDLDLIETNDKTEEEPMYTSIPRSPSVDSEKYSDDGSVTLDELEWLDGEIVHEHDNDDMTVLKEQPVFSRVRTYDLSITYDKYYACPRLWIMGRDVYGNYLSMKEMLEDISPDHSHQTVTWERHPNMGFHAMSVHPCQHAKMLRRLCDQMKMKDTSQVLEVFLYFVVTILPTCDFLARGMD